jgi:hypothetical protein
MEMSRTKKTVTAVGAVLVVMILMAVAIGVKTLGGGNLTKARRIAAQLQADAMAHPNPTASSAVPTGAADSPATTGAAATAATGVHASGSPTSGPATSTTRTPAAPATTAKPTTTTKGPAPTAATTPPPASTVPAFGSRRQPTAGEVAQAITAVHSLLPFFTPTPAQIAAAGNQVCTAFDQGQTLGQVESAALSMVGAGSIAWMIPASVPQVAIQTLVALYCPTYGPKTK